MHHQEDTHLHLLVATRHRVEDTRLTIRRHLLHSRATIQLLVMPVVIHPHFQVVLDLLHMARHLDLHQVLHHRLVLRPGKEDILHRVAIINSTVADDGE